MSYFYGMGYKLRLSQLTHQKDLSKLFREHEKCYNEVSIREKGSEDGKLSIPPLDAVEGSPFERELVHANARLASYVSSRYRGPLEILDAKIQAEEDYVDRRFLNEQQRIENIYAAEKDAAEDTYGIAHAQKQLETCDSHYKQMYDRYGRAPVWYIPHWLYLVFATIIFLGEIPLNALVFRIFGENEIMTWVMAFVIGLALPVMAHFVGIKLREHGEGFNFGNAFKATVAMGITIAALYGVSVLRETYLGEFKEDLGLTDPLVHASFLFFWLNLAVFGAAVVISYLSHDSVPGFQEAYLNVHSARRFLEKKERRRVAWLKKCAMNRAASLDRANRERHEGKNRVNLLKGSYDQILKEGQEFESRCLDRLMQDISRYRHENLRAREDRSRMPASFTVEHSFALELVKVGEMLKNGEASRGEPRTDAHH